MELLILVVIVGFLAGMPLMLVAVLARLGSIGERMRNLELLFSAAEIRGKSARAESPAVTAAKPEPALPPEPVSKVPETVQPEPSPIRPEPEAPPADPGPEPAGMHSGMADDHDLTPIEMFWAKVEDYLAVKGSFAPAGMTREFAFATRWLLRTGILLHVASVAYFMKLSIDCGWVGPTQRVCGTVAFGCVLCAIGAWMARKTAYGLVGRAFAAIGIAALYLGIGLGHRFFNPPVVESASLAFALLASVTVAGAVLAVFLDSSAVSLVGMLGAYLVPVIAGKVASSPSFMALYLFTVNLGVFAVARIRKWSCLDFVASLAAYAMFAGLCMPCRGVPGRVSAVYIAFLAAVNFLYCASVVLSERFRTKAETAISRVGLVLNSCIFSAGICTTLSSSFGEASAGAALAFLAAAYAALAVASRRFRWMDSAGVSVVAAFSVAYLAISPLYLLDADGLSPCWCAIAVAAHFAARKSRSPVLRLASWVVLSAAALAGLAGIGYIASTSSGALGDYLPLAVKDLVRVGCVPAAFAFFAWRSSGGESPVAFRVFSAFALVFAFLHLTAEAHRIGTGILPGLGGGCITAVWGVFASSLLAFGIAKRAKALRVSGLCLLGIAVFKLLASDTAMLATPWRVLLFGLTGILLLSGAFVYIRFRSAFAAPCVHGRECGPNA